MVLETLGGVSLSCAQGQCSASGKRRKGWSWELAEIVAVLRSVEYVHRGGHTRTRTVRPERPRTAVLLFHRIRAWLTVESWSSCPGSVCHQCCQFGESSQR